MAISKSMNFIISYDEFTSWLNHLNSIRIEGFNVTCSQIEWVTREKKYSKI